ncbi:glycosyltransferase [Dyadobacter tibetensis]|uniref:glycosyltransferase n=1 Tax=Dyadobacter tibetensis TaxID=1211851 RepID=UPI0004709143|nr:glycosyltransferase [Dyadobacter tibetensis]
MTTRVLLLSTIHPATDPRIVLKIAPALALRYQVFCCLPHARLSSNQDPIQYIPLPYFRLLVLRLLITHAWLLLRCLALRPGIVHIFVPELIPIAALFRLTGAQVIYEVQEDLAKKFSIKRYNKAYIFRYIWGKCDRWARNNFSVIFTEDAYLEHYQPAHQDWAVIHNYVSLELLDNPSKGPLFPPHFIYSGVISWERCLDVMIEAFTILKMEIPEFKVHLFGKLQLSAENKKRIMRNKLVKEHFIWHGYQDLRLIAHHAIGATAGIALLRPVADYPESFSTKIFEYMAWQLPVITSDFKLYRDVVESHHCGYCIPPEDPELLARNLTWLCYNPKTVVLLGSNGRNAAQAHYNWYQEKKKLILLYEKLEKRHSNRV